uniref:Lysosome-associated membrane glycoprotein 1 n=1 Tax=Naja naja TaxID=35670 RepID=A0A8C6YG65_NAJNA
HYLTCLCQLHTAWRWKICIQRTIWSKYSICLIIVHTNATFILPSDANVIKEASTCDKKGEQILAVGFGKEHSLNMTFEKKNESVYMVSALGFKFNLNDSSIFPNSSGELTEVKKGTDIQADLNTLYLCHSNNAITAGKVFVLLSNVSVEAYCSSLVICSCCFLETICSEDKSHNTTVSPTHQPSTRTPPTTVVTTTSVPPSLKPEVGQYSVNDSSGTCLLASMGLQLNLTYSAQNKSILSKVLNIPPNAVSSGKCDNMTVTLNLTSGSTKISLSFAQVSIIQCTALASNLDCFCKSFAEKSISVANYSLSALKATIGKSYKCVAEETIQVSDKAFVNMYNVQVQAFKIAGFKFGAVEECQLDENNMLIPIVVGAALAGLVLIVLIAYLIGRKRSHAGYQTI